MFSDILAFFYTASQSPLKPAKGVIINITNEGKLFLISKLMVRIKAIKK